MAKLSDLILLRNDPEIVTQYLKLASDGDVDACYGLGLIYAEGRGTPQDECKAYYWLTRAMVLGDADAELLRQLIIDSMTQAQYERAQLLVKADITSH